MQSFIPRSQYMASVFIDVSGNRVLYEKCVMGGSYFNKLIGLNTKKLALWFPVFLMVNRDMIIVYICLTGEL